MHVLQIIKMKQDILQHIRHAYDTENNQSDLNLKWKFTPKQNILLGAIYQDAKLLMTSSIRNQ